MSGVMVDLVAVILSGLRPHGGFGKQVTEHNPLFDLRNPKTTMRTQTT